MSTGRTVQPSAEETVRRLLEEGLGAGSAAAIHDLVAPEYVHNGRAAGPDYMRNATTHWHTAFPDFRISIEEVFTAGDRVVARLTMHGTHEGEWQTSPIGPLPPTGKPMTRKGIVIFRVANGKVFDGWVCQDSLGMLLQLGAVSKAMPVSEPATS